MPSFLGYPLSFSMAHEMFFLLALHTLFASFLAHLPFLDAVLGAYAQSVFQSSRAGRFIAII